jgi:hypothetical protein
MSSKPRLRSLGLAWLAATPLLLVGCGGETAPVAPPPTTTAPAEDGKPAPPPTAFSMPTKGKAAKGARAK